MELIQFPSYSVLLTFIIFIFFLSIIWKQNTNSTKNLPPGPWKLPLIGSIHHLVGSLPHRRLQTLANKYGPIMHLQLGELSNIVISSPDLAKEVMKTHDITFAQRPFLLAATVATYNYTDIAFSPYGDYWRQIRKICTVELLTAKRVDSFRPIREEQVSRLIRSLSNSEGSTISFTSVVNSLVYSITSKTAFGKIWEGEEIFIAAVRDLMVALGGFSIAELYPSIKLLQTISGMSTRLGRIHNKIDNIFQNIIDEHRARRATPNKESNASEDLVDVLLDIQDQGNLQLPLTDDNIKAIILDMFSAGIETSATAIEWTMSELMKNPSVMEKAQEEVRRVFGAQGDVDESRLHELEYFKSVIKEALRLHPPLPLLLPRECREKSSIYSYEIPVKSRVIVNAWAMARDPNYWKEPDKFIPERFTQSSIDYRGTNFEYLPFGAGRRICPGMTYGMMNVEYPLAQLLFYFDWKLPKGITPENLDMAEVFGASTKRKKDLHLIPYRFVPVM